MPMIPAFCDNCGTAFSSGIFAENVTNLTLNNVTSGPCPNCGGTGRTQNGVFNVINGVISKLKEANYTKEELESLIELLKIYQEKEEYTEVEISEEKQSILAPIFEFLPQDRKEKRAAFGYLITTLISILTMFFSQSSETAVNYDIDININPVMKQTVEQEKTGEYSLDRPNKFRRGLKNPAIKQKKYGRNEKCHCGSGIKYKKCHGQ